jgi:hypothetical protein
MVSGLLENLSRPLKIILSLNAIAHTVGSTRSGAQAVVAVVGVFSTILSLLRLVLSEVTPKDLGRRQLVRPGHQINPNRL